MQFCSRSLLFRKSLLGQIHSRASLCHKKFFLLAKNSRHSQKLSRKNDHATGTLHRRRTQNPNRKNFRPQTRRRRRTTTPQVPPRKDRSLRSFRGGTCVQRRPRSLHRLVQHSRLASPALVGGVTASTVLLPPRAAILPPHRVPCSYRLVLHRAVTTD